jgi:hypothetical protein
MENLKVRFVITYKSSATGNLNSPRPVPVELVNPKTGAPIQIVDVSGETIHAHVVLGGQLCLEPSSGSAIMAAQPQVDTADHVDWWNRSICGQTELRRCPPP